MSSGSSKSNCGSGQGSIGLSGSSKDGHETRIDFEDSQGSQVEATHERDSAIQGEQDRLLQRLKLCFRDPVLEAAYMKSQEDSLYQTCLWGHGVMFFFGALGALTATYSHGSVPGIDQPEPVVIIYIGYFVVMGWSLLFILAFNCPWWPHRRSYAVVEAATIVSAMIACIVATALNQYRLAVAFSMDPQKVWDRSYFSDSAALLYLDLIITTIHLFIPIRTRISWLIVFAALVSYVACLCFWGSPELNGLGLVGVCKLCIQLSLLGILAWVGKRRVEKEARLAFAQKEQLKKAAGQERRKVVEERVLRCSLERQLDQAKDASMQPASSSGRTPNDSDTLTYTTFETTFEPEAIIPLERSEHEASKHVSQTVSEIVQLKGSVWKHSCMDSYTQTFSCGMQMEENGVQTDISGSQRELKCMRCSLPPAANGQDPNRDRIMMVSLAEKLPKLKRYLAKAQANKVNRHRPSKSKDSTVLSNFSSTPDKTVKACLHQLLIQINPASEEMRCCDWHMALENVLCSAQEICFEQCKEQWKPISGKQCAYCFLMAYQEDVLCRSCGRGNFLESCDGSAPRKGPTVTGLSDSTEKQWERVMKRYEYLYNDARASQ